MFTLETRMENNNSTHGTYTAILVLLRSRIFKKVKCDVTDGKFYYEKKPMLGRQGASVFAVRFSALSKLIFDYSINNQFKYT